MRCAPLLSTLGYAFLHASHAFEFTSPDSAQKLDLTKPITITWDANNGPFIEHKARALDLWFSVRTSNDSGGFGWELATNLSLSAGSYKWKPDGVVKSINDTGASISPDAVHSFEARLLNNSGSQLSTVESGKYAVEGFDLIRNTGGKGAQAGSYTAGLVCIMVCLALH